MGLLVLGCTSETVAPDATTGDVGPDAGADVGPDAGVDGGPDGGGRDATSGDGSADARVEIATGDFAGEYRRRYCEPAAVSFCAGAGECRCLGLPGIDPEPAACATRTASTCAAGIEPFLPGLGAGELVLRLDLLDACLARARAVLGPCALPDPAAVANPCRRLFATREPLGGPCTGPVCADGEGLCREGRCSPVPALGEECGGLCGGELLCHLGRCVAAVADGGDCDDDRPCAAPAVCRAGKCRRLTRDGPCAEAADCPPTTECVMGRCAPAGASCAPSSPACAEATSCIPLGARVCVAARARGESCSGEGCDRGLYCDGTSGRCADLPGLDQPCGNGTACTEGLACDFMNTVCRPVPGDGEPCALGTFGPFVCGAGLGCLGDTCRPLPGLGAECTVDSRCAEGLGCDFAMNGSFCVERRDPGGECTNDRVCKAGSFCDFGTLRCTPVVAPGGPCTDGNECGPDGACLPTDRPREFACAPRPGLGGACFLYDDCQAPLTCGLSNDEGRCAPEAYCAAFLPR